MLTDDAIVRIRQKYQALLPNMDERMRRLWAAAEAKALGWGGIACVAEATGLARNTITAGLRDLQQPLPAGRIRREGGGPKPLTARDPGLEEALDRLVDPVTRGHPESPLRWTCKSTSKLAEELTSQGHPVSARTVAALLHQAGYSLQACRKTQEGGKHPDRNAQFLFIHDLVRRLQKRGEPVVSVDAKKKELVGNYKNAGQEWQPGGEPAEVKVHDFPDRKLGKAVPYGVYDLSNNEGWVSVGINHDTAQFAVASIGRWWEEMGQKRFPGAKELLITADGGGSNAAKNRLWKVALQALADETGLKLRVSHLPPGTSKWNKIEHRLFCHISTNWRGRPLTSYEMIVSLIANTTTSTGLVVRAALDPQHYEKGIQVSDEELAKVNLKPNKFHGEWNYCIAPLRQRL
jgi:Rhodopirellula transposase DDE domain